MSNQKGTRGRGKDGLTPKMRLAIPIIAVADVPYQGLLRCVDLGIMSGVDYYYKVWAKDAAFVEVYEREREKFRGTYRDTILTRFQAHAAGVADRVIRAAYDGGAKQQQIILQSVGVDCGLGTRIRVSQNVGGDPSIEAQQAEYQERASRLLSKRMERIVAG